jgi:hypothetical protein
MNTQAPCEVVLIEPYPAAELFALFPKDWIHRQCILQRTPPEIFEALGNDDVCFYDRELTSRPR